MVVPMAIGISTPLKSFDTGSDMTSDEIREAFLSYFESKGHLRVASSSLIPVGDPTLLLTNAGMVQFKPYFTGEAAPPNKRLTSSQKSFRTVDIDEVGDSTHLTLFEMLGNFSIGDYFKKEAIDFALEFVTTRLGLSQERFVATIYLDDEESFELWREAGIPEERIHRFGDEENWWGPAGSEGPCGPCSELHYDFGADRGCGTPDCGPNCTHAMKGSGDACDRFVEVWNLVFMQFYHHLDGTRTPLPAPSVDTGTGLERTATVMQGVNTVYETDIFKPLIGKVEELSGKRYGTDRDTDYAMHILAEHARSSTFLIADGVVPGNEGRGYVLRRVIRRAIRHGRRLGLEQAFLGDIATVAVEKMGDVYPELRNHQELILSVLRLEEERFHESLRRGLQILDGFWKQLDTIESKLPSLGAASGMDPFILSQAGARVVARWGEFSEFEAQGALEALRLFVEPSSFSFEDADSFGGWGLSKQEREFARRVSEIQSRLDAVKRELPGEVAFLLWDTYGFPVEMTQEIAREKGIEVDLEGFEREMDAQRQRARASAQFGGDRSKIRVYESMGLGATKFLGYQQLTTSSVVVGLISGGQVAGEVSDGQDCEVVLVETPFYPEGGGQVGDAGELVGPSGKIEVSDTQMVMPDVIVHFGKVAQGSVAVGGTMDAYVDPVRREDTARNHTATHLLHAALRQLLGAHVRQAGSLVAPDRLRFDFTHVEPLTQDEIWEVQWLVNEKIRQNASVLKAEDSYASAIKRGALAFFGDKYGEDVRLIEIANGETFSFEVCGGTHVGHTGEVGAVYVLGESSIGAGMRRLEAVSGRAAEKLVRERFGREDRLLLKLQTTPPDLESRVQSLLDELDELRREKEAVGRRLSLQAAEGLLASKQEVNGVTVLAVRASAPNVDALRQIGDWLRDKLGSAVVVLGSVLDDRPILVAMVTPDLVAKGIDASELVKGAAKAIQGGGGGQPDVAQAGGRRADKLDEALSLVPDLVREKSAAS